MSSSLYLPFFVFFFLSVSSASHQWEKFHNLAGFRLGDTNPTIIDLKNYLHQFGYLPNVHPSKINDSFDDELHSALRTYQRNFNLKATGILDPPTIHLLTTPRCGVPDIINGATSMLSGNRLRYSYFSGNPRWPPTRHNLSYAIGSIIGADMDIGTIRQVIAQSFKRWADVTDFSFHEVSPDGPSDITIGFVSGDHGDGVPFEGQLGALAHAFAPTDGRLHFDVDEDWSTDVSQSPSRWAFDLESVAVHEMGHILGMEHSSVEEAMMYPTIIQRTKKVDLANDDILGIRNLYGLSAKEKHESELHVAY